MVFMKEFMDDGIRVHARMEELVNIVYRFIILA